MVDEEVGPLLACLSLLLVGVIACSCLVPVDVPREPRIESSNTKIPKILKIQHLEDSGAWITVGSAVPIKQRGRFLWVLTAKHCTPCQRVSGHKVLAQHLHPSLDLALLKLQTTCKTLRISRDPVKPGDRLRTAGWYLSHFLAMIDGRARPLSGFEKPGCVSMTCLVLPGSSGGAVLNARGDLVGITSTFRIWTVGSQHWYGPKVPQPVPWLSAYTPLDLQARRWVRRITQSSL